MRDVKPGKRLSVAREVEEAVERVPITDVHTHLYDPAFRDLWLWGIDDLLTYHYLVAEVFRFLSMPYAQFWKLSKVQQADLIWETLFVTGTPLSEACRGVLTTLQALGLDSRKRDLKSLRKWFAAQDPVEHLGRCMDRANVKKIFMTNSPFDPAERVRWERGFRRDARFLAALRIDPLLLAWSEAAPILARSGYRVTLELSKGTVAEIRRFLADWTRRIDARYLMVSLPPEFDFPDRSPCSRMLEEAVLPQARASGLPLALMPGVRRAMNPELKLAGDGVGSAKMQAIANLCARYPENKFLATVLPRENQHELCVVARKFRNLHLFGCWWFTNNPSLIDEMTRMRLELLGLSFTVQHSDARVVDQLIYKWRHTKEVVKPILVERYQALAEAGWQPTRQEIQRDAGLLFGGAFEAFCRS